LKYGQSIKQSLAWPVEPFLMLVPAGNINTLQGLWFIL